MSNLTPEIKVQIDALSVYDLLYAHRFASVGDPCFQGEQGEYRMRRLAELRNQDNDAYVRASKDMGW